MEFLVEIVIELPADMPAEERARLSAKEAARGRELIDQGTIARIWRLPGRRANVGIWCAADASELHAAIASLPLFRWIDATVTPLAMHPLED